ncbi:MAG: hypothetical protein ACOY5Y_12190 [Pseudomonadota bacterium]
MNLSRGLFRAWLVASAVFIVALVGVRWSSLQLDWRSLQEGTATPESLVPVRCLDARGAAGADFETITNEMMAPPDAERLAGFCLYQMKAIRRLYPEYNDLSDGRLSDMLYAKAGMAPDWQGSLRKTALAAVLVPLSTLLLGLSVLWAFRGFTSKPSSI